MAGAPPFLTEGAGLVKQPGMREPPSSHVA
jgi:hypothetical protein